MRLRIGLGALAICLLVLLDFSCASLRSKWQQIPESVRREVLQSIKRQKANSNARHPSDSAFPPVFNCTALPKPPPSNDVNKLKPGNIQAIMNLGDSISAGFAMHAYEVWDITGLVEYRGDVFDIGGNPGQYTLPNWFKLYNPGLQGASIGYSLPLDAIRWENHIIQPFDPAVAHLGAAQSQAKVEDVPAQVDYLEQQLKTTYSKSVDFENDWKMVTLLIGANNLCGACKNRSYADPDYYEQQLELVVTKLYKQIPRTLVNIMPMFNISQVHTFASKSTYCNFMWDYVLPGECMCLMGDATDDDRRVMDERAVEFRKRVYKVAERWQAMNLSNFTVKVQPCVEDLQVVSLDYLSDFDCFHPKYLADAGFAIGLWNNFWTPQAQKQKNIWVGMQFVCPDENSYIQ